MLKELSYEASAYLLSKLVGIGESRYRIGDELAAKGVTAFRAHLQLFEGLAKNEQELTLHRTIEIERAKEEFANPFRTIFGLAESGSYHTPYISSLLAQLREENDPTGELRKTIDPDGMEEWRLEIDPCRRTYYQLDYSQRAERRRACIDNFIKLRATEIECLLRPPHSRSRYGDADARKCADEIISHGLGRFGFEQNKKISSKAYTFFTKPLVDDWIVCITMISDAWGFDGYSYEIVNGERRISPKMFTFVMDLRRSKQKGLNHKTLSTLRLDIARISPLGEFDNSFYLDMDEMAAGLLGYTQLYGVLAGELESKLIEGLSEL
ncbi:hypothetical protein FNU76_23755 [Chitinimonas arctica]|uniref:Uncharacterized protein n=1 Tax=Chitinimonas arctica TaxID=2594795 RepID=A0A516SLT7_9NEIS|nr:hypothetical protein [Chitinimonas arctica]QDQ29121.1 hypothetical protein FNU76_23755 [Chitinimonas arctica]